MQSAERSTANRCDTCHTVYQLLSEPKVVQLDQVPHEEETMENRFWTLKSKITTPVVGQHHEFIQTKLTTIKDSYRDEKVVTYLVTLRTQCYEVSMFNQNYYHILLG